MTLFTTIVTAQNEGQYSHFMFNRLSYNPAYAGSSGAISFTALYNNQWMGLELQAPVQNVDPGTTPTNYLFSFDMPVSFLHGGIGATFNSESIGYHSNTTINIDYAFRIYWGPGNLAAAVEANLYNFSFNTANLRGAEDLTGDLVLRRATHLSTAARYLNLWLTSPLDSTIRCPVCGTPVSR